MSYQSRQAAHRADKNRMVRLCVAGFLAASTIILFYTGYLAAFVAGAMTVAGR